MVLPLLLAGLLVTAAAATADVRGTGKSVLTSLDSQWHHTSFLAETSEFVARDSNKAFWDFVDKVTTDSTTPSHITTWSNRTHEHEYDVAVKQAVAVLSTARLDLLKLALSLRLYSPRIQVHQQLGEIYGDLACEAFAVVGDATTCKPEGISKLVDSAKPKEGDVYSIDHIHPLPINTDEDSLPNVFIYGQLGSAELAKFHETGRKLAKNGKARYILRHFAKTVDESKVGLSGYGVELAIKNTEYKAVDDSHVKAEEASAEEESDIHGFNFATLKANHPQLKTSLDQFKVHLIDLEELTPLKQWEVSDISLQAAQKIVDAAPEEAIALLTDLSQNFPIRARSLVQTKVKADFREEVEGNQELFKQELQIAEGESALFVNGINLDVDSLDVFQIFDVLNAEEKLSSAFFNMGFRKEYLSLLFNLDLTEEKSGGYAIDYREAYPEYINNLDKDKVYKQWGNSVKLMLQPYFPGMLRPIARNFFTLIAVVDPLQPESWNIIKTAHAFYSHQVPLRIGFVFVVNDDKTVTGKTDPAVALLNLYNFAKADRTPAKAINLMSKCIESLNGKLTVEGIHRFFKKTFKDIEIDDVFGPDSDYDTGRVQGAAFVRKSGIGATPKVLVNGVILDDEGIVPDKLEETILTAVMKQTSTLQRAIMTGKLTDKENVQNWILNQPEVLPRRNERLLSPPEQFLDIEDVYPCESTAPSKFATLSAAKRTQCILTKAKYLTKADTDKTYPLTLWVVADFDTVAGRNLLSQALKYLKKSTNARISIIHNGQPPAKTAKITASKLIHGIWRLLSNSIAKQMLTKLLSKESVLTTVLETSNFDEIAVHGMNLDSFKKEFKQLSDDHLNIESQFVRKVLNFAPGDRALIINGQVFGPLTAAESFEAEDFFLAEKIAQKKGAKAVAEQIDLWNVEKHKSSDVVMRSIGVIGKHAAKKPRTWVSLHGETESVVNLIATDTKRATLDVVAIVDPLSKSAQKIAPILDLLAKVINADVKIVMNPKAKLSELPLKRFYRLALKDEPTFDSTGKTVSPTIAFSELPSKQLLTLNVISPDSWMVQPIYALYDLDNIKMQSVKQDVVAKFELIHILLEGHCFDDVSGNPPRGLQFILGTQDQPQRFDTIVMANLGYFQLKASPGAWILQLREGKSKDIYEIKNHTNTETALEDNNDKVRVLIDSFLGKTIRVLVNKRPGMEQQTLLADAAGANGEEEESGGNGIWSSLSSTLTGSNNHEVINIFSLASGHLYERFLRIMMMSVVKNTKHPVKFWLLNNYLSPQFRESIPKLAEAYKFEYELVEYKWPRWLHQQSEKQRIMWGYKILFLDVLFPLDVKKIIFVDADQVVRTDMMELMNLDLDGAPYGFTPFCDSRTTMEGFRFWKRGYWSQHLAGRRYHISALYVIDLVKFRQIAAGDRLRGQYQGLSSDPNSLANLDQDLPNNMIHQVRIKSLPQDWLWCETWCDDSTKKSAKTIDLCNNPQTKEPKLDSAVRIIPEWKEYDEEIRRVINGTTEAPQPPSATPDEHSEL
uniref:UDP-glucose:glycoprotein glucosyltransferase n=1 Tax=Panagrellus redivivus TaxID=6233 RepID=A0A7E4VIA0_PANRE